MDPSLNPLFSLPEYERAQFEFVHEAIRKLMECKDELYASIPKAEPTEAIPVTQNTMPSGEIVQNKPLLIEAKFTFQWDDIRSCNLEVLAEQVDGAADQMLAVIMPRFFEVSARMCQAAGTASDAGGKPFSFELWLSGLEKIDLEFDNEGNPILPTLIVHPELAKRILSMPAWSPEQQRAYEELIDQKRRQFDARQRHRKLR